MNAGQWGQVIVVAAIVGYLTATIVGWTLDRSSRLKLGTRSVLYGAHCFLFHWFFVAKAWHQLYGWRAVRDRYVGMVSLKDPRLWLAFLVHDIGYIGKPKMDDAEGETHPVAGSLILQKLFGMNWGLFSLLHSRYYAKTLQFQPSLLCVADKLALALTPAWLYLPLVRATGEIEEYMRMDLQRRAMGENRREITYADEARIREREEKWFADVQKYMREWVEAHKDGSEDTWTKSQLFKDAVNQRADYVTPAPLEELARTSITDSGVTA
jgi:hypothetical protein